MAVISFILCLVMRHLFNLRLSSFVINRLFWVATLFFLGLTSFYITAYNAYQPTDKEWLSNSDFKAGLEGWKISNAEWVKQDVSGVVTLSLSEPKKYLALYQRLNIDSRLPLSQVKEGVERPTPFLLQLLGIARTFSIGKGDKEWHEGRLSLVFYDKKGKRVSINAIPLPHHNPNWREYRKTFEVPRQVASVRVNVNLLQVTGTVQIKEIHLVPVTPKAEAKYIKLLGLLVWMIMMLWLMSSYARYFWSRSKGGVLLVSVLMLGAIVSGDIKLQLMSQLPELVYSITPSLTLDKDVFAHFLFFFIAAVIMVSGSRHKRWWQVVIDLVLLGLFIECAQVFVEGRTADFMDLWVDIIGIVAGGVVAWFWLFFRAIVNR
jgi:VanZ family protein